MDRTKDYFLLDQYNYFIFLSLRDFQLQPRYQEHLQAQLTLPQQ